MNHPYVLPFDLMVYLQGQSWSIFQIQIQKSTETTDSDIFLGSSLAVLKQHDIGAIVYESNHLSRTKKPGMLTTPINGEITDTI